MSRIFLSQRKKNTYWICDILDGKKLGKLIKKHGQYCYAIKPKYMGQFLETEALLLLDKSSTQTFAHVYRNHIQQYCLGWKNLDAYHLPMYVQACRLQACENDLFQRKTYLHPAAKKAWHKMRAAAKLEQIDLHIISAFRSLDYQAQLIQNKINQGQLLHDILKVNTLPGFSEHHSGCAIDIGSANGAILTEEFDQSAAFNWLDQHAHNHDFYLTYPKNNPTGILYEPWHWCYKPQPIQR